MTDDQLRPTVEVTPSVHIVSAAAMAHTVTDESTTYARQILGARNIDELVREAQREARTTGVRFSTALRRLAESRARQ